MKKSFKLPLIIIGVGVVVAILNEIFCRLLGINDPYVHLMSFLISLPPVYIALIYGFKILSEDD